MRKIMFILLAIVAVSVLCSAVSFAQIVTYPLTATVPEATGAVIEAYRVVDGTWDEDPTSELDFNPLEFDPEYGFWAPAHYFVITVAGEGGAGNPTSTFTYTNGQNPNAPGRPEDGLGYKTVITFNKFIDLVGEEEIYQTQILQNADSGITVTPAQLTGGSLRVYLGIYTGEDEVEEAQLFLNTDEPGEYTGTLTISSTIAG